MYKRIWIGIAVAILVFIFNQNEIEKLFKPNEIIEKIYDKSAEDSAWKLNPDDENKALAAKNSIEASEKDTRQKPFDLEKFRQECYSKVEMQVPSNHSYMDYNREKLNQVVGEWFYELKPQDIDKKQPSSKQDKFFRALAKAGLLLGLDDIERDDSEALKLLKEVAQEDPENSAPILYAVVIQKRRGNTKAADQLLTFAEKRSRYDNFIKDYLRALYGSVEQPEDIITALNTWSASPVPSSVEIGPITANSETLSKQLAGDALNYKTNPYELNYYFIDYAIGRKNLEKMNKADGYPPWKELAKKNADSSEEFTQKLLRNCDLAALKSEVEKVKAILAAGR